MQVYIHLERAKQKKKPSISMQEKDASPINVAERILVKTTTCIPLVSQWLNDEGTR